MYSEPASWRLPNKEKFYASFKLRNELYSMTLPDWEIAEKYLTKKRRCLDIGGHVGTTALRYANNFQHVYSWEPLYTEEFKENLAHVDNITLYEQAASDCKELVHIIRRKGNSGLTMIATPDNERYKKKGAYEVVETPVQTMRIDDLHLEQIDFVKMDTEGFVLKPLLGMVDTLEQNDWPLLQIEFNKLCPNKTECVSLLSALGYEKVDAFHVDEFYVRA